MTNTTVFVSGATGYIARHIVKQLLEKGYNVVGSVRTATKDNFSYEVVPTLDAKGAFDEALKKHPEVTVFLHTASPATFDVIDFEKETTQPAIKGTKNALSAIKKHAPQVERVVYTSSIFAVIDLVNNPDKVYDEDSWSSITYEQVQPAGVFGPQAYGIDGAFNISAQMVNSVAQLAPSDKIPEEANLFIDVRDTVKTYIVAFEKDEAIGQRLLWISEPYTYDGIAHIINENFPESRVPKGDLAKDKELKKNVHKYNTSRTNMILGFDFISLEQSIIDSVKEIYESK